MIALVFQGINLFLLLLLLVLVSRKKIRAAYDRQHEDFRAKLSEANAQFEETRAAHSRLKQEMANLENTLAEMRQASIREIENETQRVSVEADRQIESTIQDGEKKIRAEAEKLKAGLERELLDSSLVLARKTLQKNLGAQDAEWISQMVGPESGATTGKKNYAS